MAGKSHTTKIEKQPLKAPPALAKFLASPAKSEKTPSSASPNLDEPEWIKDAEKKLRRYGNGTDPVSAQVPGIAPNPEPDEFQGTLRERGVQKELAAALINVQTVTLIGWISDGGMRLTHDGFVPIMEVRRKLIEVARTRAGAGRLGVPQESRRTGQAIGVGNEDRIDHEDRLKKAKADKAELEFAEALGSVVDRGAVTMLLADNAATVKSLLLSLPDRLVNDIVALGANRHKIRELLATEFHEILKSLSKPFRLRREHKEMANAGRGSGEEGAADKEPG